MKRKVEFLLTMLIVTMTVALTGCQSNDPGTEQKLEGTWTYSYSDSEDGVSMSITAMEEYVVKDHTFKSTLTFYVGYPINSTIATVSYNGKWHATKKEIINEIEKKSINFSFNKSIMDKNDRKEFKDELLMELRKNGYREGVRIKSPIGDSFRAVDDDGEEYMYERVY